jgi:hypothetical protein
VGGATFTATERISRLVAASGGLCLGPRCGMGFVRPARTSDRRVNDGDRVTTGHGIGLYKPRRAYEDAATGATG